MNDVYYYNENINIKLIAHEYSSVFSSRTNHEIEFRKIIKRLIDGKYIHGDILDAGAFVGDNAIPWALLLNPIVHGVVCVDPSSKNCEFIKEMAIHNGIKNLEVLEGGLSDKNKKMYTDDSLFHCVLSENTNSKNEINVFTIDSISNYFKNSIDFIHLDVEGQEHNCIIGAIKTIEDNLPIICFEQHIETDNYRQTANFLKNFNYKTYIINEILPGCRRDCRNLLSTTEVEIVDFIKSYDKNILNEVIV